ncbi:hypothetical protein MNBD_BACTEROID06-1266 [hydrothermal vent metagenome]|uniref:Calcineurin-like phosphoesterase domain-containing protein n=1 Tax=hydrothermal vent metagenome TaxID=652676 RepID=A0A3B0UMJ0_9ZZZZ
MKYKMRTLYMFILLAFASNGFAQSLKIGIIADCQYCDCDYSKRWNNDYRQGPPRLQKAVDKFNNQEVDVVFHLGDFIDRDFSSFARVKPIMNTLKMPHYFALGNHDFSVADSLKNKVLKTLDLASPYYIVEKDNWLFVVLDGTDVSPYSSTDLSKIAFANSQMEMYEKEGRLQAKPWNGALGTTQMEWLEAQLQKADMQKLNVIVLAHFPILPLAALNLWNDVEVVQILEKHTSVKAYFNGHHHPGNYVEKEGIHYVTFQGMVMTKEETAYAVVTLGKKEITVEGVGREPFRTLRIK